MWDRTLLLVQMTKREAIKLANSKPRNQRLQYYVIKWGRGYALAPSSYMKRHPDTEYVYVTQGEKEAIIK
jgi:hypothetical protein